MKRQGQDKVAASHGGSLEETPGEQAPPHLGQVRSQSEAAVKASVSEGKGLAGASKSKWKFSKDHD